MIPAPLFTHTDPDGTRTEAERMPDGGVAITTLGDDVGDRQRVLVVSAAAWRALRGGETVG